MLWQGWAWVIRAGAAAVAEQGSSPAGGSAFMGLLSLVPGLCLGSSWPESVPHIRISPPALSRGRGVLYPGAAAIPSPARQERARAHGLLHSCTWCSHTSRILGQNKAGNLHKLDGAMLVRLLRAPQGSATSTW